MPGQEHDAGSRIVAGVDGSPSSVSAMPRGSRSNNGTPSQSSNNLICLPIAQWVTPKSDAASAKLPRRAAASNARTALRGGRPDRSRGDFFSLIARE